METNQEKIDRFCSRFEQSLAEIMRLEKDNDIFARILLTTMLDTFAKVAFDDIEDSRSSGERYSTFVSEYADWPESVRVSLLHLARALSKEQRKEFEALRDWVEQSLRTALPLPRDPHSFVHHPSEVEQPLSVDPKLDEVRHRWPGHPRPEKLRVPSPSGKETGLHPFNFTHAYLLWEYRSRLVHEFREPGDGWDVKKEGMPYYQLMSHGKWVDYAGSQHGNLVVLTRQWELVYPLGFLAHLCKQGLDTLRNLLISENRSPYQSFRFGSYWISVLN